MHSSSSTALMEFSQAKYPGCFYVFILPSDLFWRSYDAKMLERKCLLFREVCAWVTALCSWQVAHKERKMLLGWCRGERGFCLFSPATEALLSFRFVAPLAADRALSQQGNNLRLKCPCVPALGRMDSERGTSDIAPSMEARAAWLKAQTKKQLNLCTPHQPGLLFTRLWAKEKGVPPWRGGEEQPGTSKNDEENPSSREPSLQEPFTHPGMHFPPIPPPLATLQTAGPAVMWSLWCQPDHPGSCSHPILPSRSRSRTSLMAKQSEKQNRTEFCSSSLWFQQNFSISHLVSNEQRCLLKKEHMHIFVCPRSNSYPSV